MTAGCGPRRERDALVNAVEALSKSTVPFMPNTLVMGGSGGSGTLEGVMALLMRH